MFKNQRLKAGDVLGLDLETLLFELLQRGVDVDSVPKDDDVLRPVRALRANLLVLHDIAGGVRPAFRGRWLAPVYGDLHLC